MTHNNECPVCGSLDTHREWVEWLSDGVVEIRTCECGAEYENKFFDAIRNVTRNPEDEDE
jgi:Zn ribbon nucleic-acid-binding protein